MHLSTESELVSPASLLVGGEREPTPADHAAEQVLRVRDRYVAAWALAEQLLAIGERSSHGRSVHLPGCARARAADLVWVRPLDLELRARDAPEFSRSCLPPHASALSQIASSWGQEPVLLAELARLRTQLRSSHGVDRAAALYELLSERGGISSSAPLALVPSGEPEAERTRLLAGLAAELSRLSGDARLSLVAAMAPGTSWASTCTALTAALGGEAAHRACADEVVAICLPAVGMQGRMARLCFTELAAHDGLAALRVPRGSWEQLVPLALRAGPPELQRRAAERRGWIELDGDLDPEVLRVALALAAEDLSCSGEPAVLTGRERFELHLRTARDCVHG